MKEFFLVIGDMYVEVLTKEELIKDYAEGEFTTEEAYRVTGLERVLVENNISIKPAVLQEKKKRGRPAKNK